MSSTIYLNIGSNQGDRRAHIEQAVALIAGAFSRSRVRLSDYVESAPWGYVSDYYFLNLGVAVDMDSAPDPHQVMKRLLQIQRSISDAPHRDADNNYCDRAIDIDIVCIDKMRLCDDSLELPHPRAWKRPFVMGPLEQLAPEDVVDFVRSGHLVKK